MNIPDACRTSVSIIKFAITNPSEISFRNLKKFNIIARNLGLAEALKKTNIYSASKTKQINKLKTTKIQEFRLETIEQLDIPFYDEVEISIIIPAYNQIEYTYNCIQSIIKTTNQIKYEIILADDCSTDKTINIQSFIKNLIVIRPEHNLRFTLNCNNAAEYAKGKYIVFLNNDTIVKDGWLFWLKKILDDRPDVGLVGSKLIYQDGTLQEAGGIIWSDGSGWNYGRGQNPELPEYNYVKEVDYISGASIMIRKTLWKEIGGFDKRFAPSYCEDSDLCFEVRKHGYKVVYQPLSELAHFEGISNGTSTSEGLKAYQITNSKKLYEKWENVLRTEQYPHGKCVFKARDRSFDKKTIILFDETVPTFDKDAGSRTLYDYIEILVEMGYNVKMMTHNFYHDPDYSKIYQQMGVEVLYGYEMYTNWKQWFKDNHACIDYAFISRPEIAEFFMYEIKKYSNIKIIYNLMDLHFIRLQRKYKLTKDPETLKLSIETKDKEFKIMRDSDVVLTVSAYELELIKQCAPDIDVKLAPGFYYKDTDYSRTYCNDTPSIMFVGGFNHTPNQDAVKWFIEKIWPTILEKIPDCIFYIIGSNPTKEIKQMERDNIIVTGYVSEEELDKYYNMCMASVVPLRYGAGIKGKVIEALHQNIPLISTSVGLEGLPNIHEYVTAYDDEQSFANGVIDTIINHNECEMKSKEYSKYISKYFSKNNIIELFEKILD